jgi:hypothetical protein
MRGLWQNRVRIFLSQMATRVEFSDSTRAAGCYPIGSSRRSKMSTGSPKYIDIRSLSGKCHPRLDPVTDQRSIACHPGLRSGISSFKRYLRPCPTRVVLLFWQKEAKPASQIKSPGCILWSAGLRTYPLNCWPWAFAKTCGTRRREIPVFRLRRKPA